MEYDLSFAAKLAKVADDVDEKDPWAYDARRVAIYLGRLSIEITLKALLEKAGVPLVKIRARSHDLRGLLVDLGQCEVKVEVVPGEKRWVSASRIRGEYLDLGLAHVPVGTIIDAENDGGSKYPNQIRYGDKLVDFDSTLVTGAALLLSAWAREHWEDIRFAHTAI